MIRSRDVATVSPEFHLVMSVTISTLQRCAVRLDHQLCFGGLMSNLRYLCLLTYMGAHTYCVVFLFSFSSSCVTCVASFSELSICIAPSLTFIHRYSGREQIKYKIT